MRTFLKNQLINIHTCRPQAEKVRNRNKKLPCLKLGHTEVLALIIKLFRFLRDTQLLK